MATVVEPKRIDVVEPERRFMLWNLDWESYEKLLKLTDGRNVRVTFEDNNIELMSPGPDREGYGKLMGQIIETVAQELALPCRGLRSTTWRMQAKRCGIASDESFYLANVLAVRGLRKRFDLDLVPPPDLVIEIKISLSSVDRMKIYAKLAIPEVWRFDCGGRTFTIHSLRRTGKCAVVAKSRALPFITHAEIVQWVYLGVEMDNRKTWARRLRRWVRAEIVPRSHTR